MHKIIISILFLGLLGSINSCNITKGLYHLNTKKVKIIHKNYDNKTILFIGNHHAGRIEYYQKLKDTISYYKQNNFIVFYERLKLNNELDSVVTDSIYRKIRKILGGLPNSDYYSVLDSIKGFMGQPSDDDLNIDTDDYNADISIAQFVNQYENLYGKVLLEKIDFNIPLKEDYNEKKMKGIDNIAIDYRNQQLAKEVYSSKHNKILILYGTAHKKGFFKELDKLYSND